jgi:hypothetical protein
MTALYLNTIQSESESESKTRGRAREPQSAASCGELPQSAANGLLDGCLTQNASFLKRCTFDALKRRIFGVFLLDYNLIANAPKTDALRA